ncbi:MAG: hypothetical protein HKO09_00890 [Croceitalea sp.]|nr:hypothetical protein [Croceitalea sp.]
MIRLRREAIKVINFMETYNREVFIVWRTRFGISWNSQGDGKCIKFDEIIK